MSAASPAPQQHKILIVDDESSARLTLEGLLQPLGHELLIATSGPDALVQCLTHQPDLVLLDVMMPGMDGFEVCRRLREDSDTATVPIVMVTALQDRSSRIRGIDAGADDFLTKPVDSLELRTRVRTTLRLNRYQRELEQRQLLNDTLRGTIELLTQILSLTDPSSFGQVQQLREMARRVGESFGYEDLDQLEMAALVCQIGRVTLPDDVRSREKSGSRLSHEDKRLLSAVPETGGQLLKEVPGFEEIAEIVSWQGKRYDGTGLPRGAIGGDEIPLGARILHLLQDLLRFEATGLSRVAAVQHCASFPGHYDPDLYEEVLSLYGSREQLHQLLNFMALRPGMITRSGVHDNSGRLLVGPGIQLTEVLLSRLRNIRRSHGLKEPVEVSLPPQPGESTE